MRRLFLVSECTMTPCVCALTGSWRCWSWRPNVPTRADVRYVPNAQTHVRVSYVVTVCCRSADENGPGLVLVEILDENCEGGRARTGSTATGDRGSGWGPVFTPGTHQSGDGLQCCLERATCVRVSRQCASIVHLQLPYVKVYAIMVAMLLVMRMAEGAIFAWVSRRASRALHDINFARVLNGTMAYFDTTPLGRILNRFSG